MDINETLVNRRKARRQLIAARADYVDALATLLYDAVNPNQEREIVFSKHFCIRAIERLVNLQDEVCTASDGDDLINVLIPIFERAANLPRA